MKKLLTLMIFTSSIFALDLNTILEKTKEYSKAEILAEQKRVEKFQKEKANQEAILKKTKQDLKRENLITKDLQKEIEANEKKLAIKEAELNEKMGDLGEMFGSVRQTSSDFLANVESSLSAAQSPKKRETFATFADSKKLPSSSELTLFWHEMLDEIGKNSEISKFESEVILNSGEKQKRTVTKVGSFVAISDGKYFNYSPELKALLELATQPNSANAQEFTETTSGVESVLIDPTRGTLLEMLNNNPTLLDRINQGGIVGYIIILLGVIGLLIAGYKSVILNRTHQKIKAQMKDLTNYKNDNPLGVVAEIFYNNSSDSISDLEIKIGEGILKESNSVKKGESFIKLLSAVTPLLGLLGTVTGMIATFQAITLFGTGDPKLMAGGISTALMTTVLGLVAAIPLLFAYTYLSSKSDTIISILEEQSIGMMASKLKNNV